MSNTRKRTPAARRVWLGGLAAVGGAAMLATSLPALASTEDAPNTAAGACEVEVLPNPDGDASWVSAIDGSGTRIAGWSWDGTKHAVIWEAGEPVKLPFPEGTRDSTIASINAEGIAAGYVYPADEDASSEGFAYVDGEIVTLDIPDGYGGVQVSDINDAGVIVGEARDADDNPRPLKWDSPDAEATELPLPDRSVSGRAKGVNNDGIIVGYHSNAYQYMWDADGEGRELPGTDDYSGNVLATAVSGDWISGETKLRDGYNTGIRWSSTDAEPELVEARDIFDISAQGDAVGDWGGGSLTSKRAAMYTADGKLHMLPFPGQATDSQAHAVSDDGSLIGGWVIDEEAEQGDMDYLPVLWHCEK